MMKLPENLPMHLMLAMMQSGAWNGASMPWSASLQPSMHNFFPWLPKPKTPLEQGAEAMQNLWQNAGDQWQAASEQWLKNLSPAPEKSQPWERKSEPASSPRRRGPLSPPEQASPEIPAFAGMTSGGPGMKEFTAMSETLAQSFADFLNPDFLTSLSTQAYNQSTGFLQGLQAYLASDYERPEKLYNILWERGSAQLLDLAPKRRDAVAVLCIPSLINRSTILDLTPETSFVEHLKAQGMRPLILDWGTPGDDETDFTTADYITAYALSALQTLREEHDGPIALLGYCMGGVFATAMAQLAPLFVDGLILLATPWDFASADTPRILLDPAAQLMLRQWIGASNPVPPLVMQTMFHLIDPWRVQEKYQRYPTLNAAQKQHFLAVEHWVNDGVPLAQATALECFVDWPQGNILSQHQWKIGRRWIEPESIKTPVLAVIPTRDLIVPLGCAMPLAEQLPRCDIITPDTGHISMIVGSRAKALMWDPVVAWIAGKF